MDPIAALKRSPVVVELGGREYTIPPIAAADWFVAILGGRPLPILPGLLADDEQEELSDALAFGEVGLDEVVAASRDALEVASGWRWWEADRLIRSAGEQWATIGGKLAQYGVDLTALPLGAALNVIWTLAQRGLNEQQRQQLAFQLSTPPAGLDEAEREALAEQMFDNLLSGGPLPAG